MDPRRGHRCRGASAYRLRAWGWCWQGRCTGRSPGPSATAAHRGAGGCSSRVPLPSATSAQLPRASASSASGAPRPGRPRRAAAGSLRWRTLRHRALSERDYPTWPCAPPVDVPVAARSSRRWRCAAPACCCGSISRSSSSSHGCTGGRHHPGGAVGHAHGAATAATAPCRAPDQSRWLGSPRGRGSSSASTAGPPAASQPPPDAASAPPDTGHRWQHAARPENACVGTADTSTTCSSTSGTRAKRQGHEARRVVAHGSCARPG